MKLRGLFMTFPYTMIKSNAEKGIDQASKVQVFGWHCVYCVIFLFLFYTFNPNPTTIFNLTLPIL